MADSAVPVTAGSGTNIDTRTQSGGDHRQVVVLGDADAAVTALVDASGHLAVTVMDGRIGPQTTSISALTSVTPAATSATVLAANANRVGFKIFNDSNVDVLLTENAAATTVTAYSLRIVAGGYYESSGTNAVWIGAVTGLGVATGTTTATAAASGALRVTDFS